MPFVQPPSSKNAVRKAGKKFHLNQETPADTALVEQWRASHGYVLNTFKVWLRNKIKKYGTSIEFAQRLKRRNTVIDKLKRKNSVGDPLIRDVTSMQDFAGCRLIFDSISDLRDFEDFLFSREVLANVKHKPKHDDRQKFDYIEKPKASGYRGVHHVFYHFPRAHRVSADRSIPWHGLMVEVQLRTRVQHAWATALEIADIVNGTRTKFEAKASPRGEQFAIASELIARIHEGLKRAFLDKSDNELVEEFLALEQKTGVFETLRTIKEFDGSNRLKKHNVLNIFKGEDGEPHLEVLPFRTAAEATSKADALENDDNSLNAVYVYSDNPNQLRSAYRNYFNDPIDFVKLLDEALKR